MRRGTVLEVVEIDAEGFAAVEVVEEGGVCLAGFGGIFLGEVHKVGPVREDVTGVSGQLLGMVILEGRVGAGYPRGGQTV